MMRTHRIGRSAVAIAVAGLVVAACGTTSDETGAAGRAVAARPLPATATTAPADTASAGTAPADEGAAPAALPGENRITDEGEPVQGGDLVYGLEADTANGWAPYRTSCATACYVLITAVSDPLFTATESGDIAPMLVESWEANEDYTEWTFNVREGVTFHDGTPLDGAAVAFNIMSCVGSPLTGAAFTMIDSAVGEGQTVTISLNSPHVVLPRNFTERQCAYMFSPTWLGTLDDLPQRTEGNPVYDADLVANTEGGGDPTSPVGVGAFVFESYTPGNGNSFRLVRNENYWRGPNGVTGENLPYLDSIEGVVSVDIDSRSNSLQSGEFDLIMSSNPDTIAPFLEDDAYEVNSSSKFGDTNYIMLNLAEGDIDPDGVNAASPLLNVHCRRALAFATDQQRLLDERSAGLGSPANGPFTPDMLGYLEDTGYPSYDPEQATAEMETCLSELGTESIEFTFNTTNDPFNVETNQLVISMWQEVFGNQVNASIEPIEQGQYIGLALVGTFNAFGWRNHGGIDPATQNYWWSSAAAAPIGSLALNFGRFRDPDMDALFQTLLTNPDEAARKAAAEDVNRIFGEQVYNIWTSWALWGIISQPYVNGVQMNAIPGGDEPGVGLAFSGRHQMNQLWCNEGSCD